MRAKKSLKRFYEKLWAHSPRPIASVLSKSVFWLADRPSWLEYKPKTFTVNDISVEVAPFPEGRRAGLIFSADFEMAWAWRYAKSSPLTPEEMGLRERRNVPLILDIFNRYKIPVTWATVGHLALENCQRDNGVAHADLERIPHFQNHVWRFKSGDWYEHDPCSSVGKSPAWYAPDLIDAILSSSNQHAIGCHTFSHIDFSDSRCPAAVAASEIVAWKTAFSRFGVTPRAMVFPGGTWGHYSLLVKEGFSCIRKRVQEDIDLFYPARSPQGLWLFPSSSPIDQQGLGWSSEYILRRLRKHIDRCIENGLVCGLWFHPGSLDQQILAEVLPDLLAYVNQLREQGVLWIGTMEHLTNHCEQCYNLQVNVESSGIFSLESFIDHKRFSPVNLDFHLLDPQTTLSAIEPEQQIIRTHLPRGDYYSISISEGKTLIRMDRLLPQREW